MSSYSWADGVPGPSIRTEPHGRERNGAHGPFTPRRLLTEVGRGCWHESVWPAEAWLRLLAVFLLVAVCSWTGIILSRQSEGVATLWLSNGVLLGLLITQPKERWLAYFAAGLVADTGADVFYGDPFRLAFGVSLANSFEVVSSSLLLTLTFGWPLNLSKRRPLIGFLLISVVAATAMTSAMGASWTLLFVDAGPWWQMFRTWYLGDMLGMAILAPTLVLLQRPAFFSLLRGRHLPHTLLVLAVPVAATTLIFSQGRDPLVFLIFPAFLLVAFRLGFPGTVLSLLLTMLLVIGFTVKGHGPLMLIVGTHMLLHRIVIAQILIAVAIFTLFPVAALLEEKDELHLSLAASEARFKQLAFGDELTGLFNRRAFNLRLQQVWDEALLGGSPVALLLLDADLFKQYNDHHGHLNGDDCLRCLAAVIQSTVASGSGIAARFGGEEFAVILPGITKDKAAVLAERIRRDTAAMGLVHPCAPTGVQTVSLGVAALVPMPAQSAAELVSLADRALYQAKISGRNQVISA